MGLLNFIGFFFGGFKVQKKKSLKLMEVFLQKKKKSPFFTHLRWPKQK